MTEQTGQFNYVIATIQNPLPTFLPEIKRISDELKEEHPEAPVILGIIIVEGPGCCNIAVMLDREDDRFMEALAMVLMPARLGRCNPDVRLTPGVFRDFRSDEAQNREVIEA